MIGQKRIRDYGSTIGEMKTGIKNAITDVKGITVGHVTLDQGGAKTGVTAILPHQGNIFKEKVFAASHVINGFGKSTGLIQIDELGTIETPIILTNTLSVGVAFDGLVEYMLQDNDDIGLTTGTVNPVICECNDGVLNEIRERFIKKEHILTAIQNADVEFSEGDVGAGTGMCCYQLKGGIGTASRIIELDDKEHTVGVLVLTNFGLQKDLMINGVHAGLILNELNPVDNNKKDKGSVIVILATDLPMTSRQLKRISKRAVVGLNRTGSFIGNGSGEVVVSFTTANKFNHYEKEAFVDIQMLNENIMDKVFRAIMESTEEAVLNSLICAKTVKGRDERVAFSLKEFINDIYNF
ncbi:MAG: P1 family peptidase [Halanaerobiales bacterium]|nr:P1 family peptidase [Halanaerobiales bacterium]